MLVYSGLKTDFLNSVEEGTIATDIKNTIKSYYDKGNFEDVVAKVKDEDVVPKKSKESTTSTTENKNNKKSTSKKTMIIIIVVAVVVALLKNPFSTRRVVETVVTKDEMKEKLNVDIKEPIDGNEVKYSIENYNIVVPSKNLVELSRMLDDDKENVSLHIFSNKVLFKYKNIIFLSRFPPILTTLKSHFNVSFNTARLVVTNVMPCLFLRYLTI